MTKTEKTSMVILALAGLLVLGIAIRTGLKKQELNECQEWSRQSKIYTNWTTADWQKQQCQLYGIDIQK